MVFKMMLMALYNNYSGARSTWKTCNNRKPHLSLQNPTDEIKLTFCINQYVKNGLARLDSVVFEQLSIRLERLELSSPSGIEIDGSSKKIQPDRTVGRTSVNV